MVHAYDQEGPFIQNKKALSPKSWLYNDMSKDTILSLGNPDEKNAKIMDKQVAVFWNDVLQEEYSNSFTSNGHIEDDISVIVNERTHKECVCGK